MYAVMTPWNCIDRAWEEEKINKTDEFNVDFMRFHSSSNHLYTVHVFEFSLQVFVCVCVRVCLN